MKFVFDVAFLLKKPFSCGIHKKRNNYSSYLLNNTILHVVLYNGGGFPFAHYRARERTHNVRTAPCDP